MARSNYTLANLRDDCIDSTIQTNIGSQIGIINILNRVVRTVNNEIDLKSAERYAPLANNVFDNVYRYVAPVDLKEIIDVAPRVSRQHNSRVRLVSPEYFDRTKGSHNLQVAVLNDDLTKSLLIDIDANEEYLQIADLDSTTSGGGTWTAVGDASGLEADNNIYVEGGASLKFDLDGSATTAGIINSTLTAIDISPYADYGYATMWVYINSTTDFTNVVLRLGTDATNYYQVTRTADSANNAFQNGWNLLLFPFSERAVTGTVTETNIGYVTTYITKTSGKSDNNYRFDDIALHTGEQHDLHYYSNYPWQSATDTYLLKATATTDTINADQDEIDLFVWKGKQEIYREFRDWEQSDRAGAEYTKAKRAYQLKWPSKKAKWETQR